MSKTAKVIVGLGILGGVGLWVLSSFKGMATFAKNLIIKPSPDFAKLKLELTGVTFPLNIDFGNRTSTKISIQINALDMFYNGKLLAQSLPSVNIVDVLPNATSTMKNLHIRIPFTALISVFGDAVNSLITKLDITSLAALIAKTQLSVDLTIDNKIQESVKIDLATGATVSGLGLTAASFRTIRPLSEYSHLIPAKHSLSYADPIVSDDINTDNTVRFMKKIAKDCKADTYRLVKSLEVKGDIRQTIKNIFDFVYTYIQYVPDNASKEQVRRPLRTLYDQKGDCDCYSVLIGSMLENLGIPYYFRVAEYNNRGFYQHVYVVVPTKQYGELVCDPVLDRCFFEKKPTKKKDF